MRFDTTVLRRAAIHVPATAAAPVRFAAAELQRYLDALSGVRLAVTTAAGSGPDTTLVIGAAADGVAVVSAPPAAGFRIVPQRAGITLEGNPPRAVLDAAYALLEQCGCRWSLHGALEEVVPRLTASGVELHAVEHVPPFAARGYCSDIMTWHYLQPEHLQDRLEDDRAFIDWMGKSGANTFFFIRHPFDTQLTIPELLPEFERRGIAVEYGGHVIPLLLPRELYATSPQYFAQVPSGGRTEHGNLCTSNAAALATVSANAVAYVRRWPEMRVLHVWGADLWHGGWCGCTACAGVSVQDQSLRVCNAVAGGLAAAGLARPVCYLAYHDTIDPQLTLAPGAGVTVEFAPRERCYGHALNDVECAINRRYAAALEGYLERFDGRVRLFEYYGDAILFFGCAVPLTKVIAADMAYYRGLGVDEITMLQFGAYSVWAYPLNFVDFAAAAAGVPAGAACAGAYCARFGAHAGAARAAMAELERIMKPLVTYGDVRRPPRAAPAAAALLARVEEALPRLDAVALALDGCADDRLAAQAALVRYTRAVLDGVDYELRDLLAGRPSQGAGRYAEALPIIDAVERRFKGLWGSVDLPIIHSYYAAATHAE